MARSRSRFVLFAGVLVLLLLILLPPVSAGQTFRSSAACSLPVCQGSSAPSTGGYPFPGPVSETYLPPPGVMPVVVLQGSPYEMGYQYGLQAPEYIAINRDAAWATALSKNTYADIVDNCTISEMYISKELTGFDFPAFFIGMSDAMNDQGIAFSRMDPVVMSYYGGRGGPVPEEHCTGFAAYGNTTGNGMIAGINFDYYQVPANSYQVLLAVYPENGYSAILPTGAGRPGSNAVANEKGLIYLLSSAPSDGKGDLGPGISGFIEIPYIGMTSATVPEAEQSLLAMTKGFALNRLLADSSGNAEVIEATRARSAIRYPHNGSYIITTNFYLDPAMKPSQKIWDAEVYYPSTYYRYITLDKEIRNTTGNLNYGTAKKFLSLTDWWDGKQWHYNDPWSTNTISRFRSDVGSIYSFIAMPGENVVSVCTGNPGMPYWGTKAPGQTGTYINYTVSKTPAVMVYNLRRDADSAFWNTVKVLGSSPAPETARLYTLAEEQYWEAVWWQDRGVLETDRTARAVAFGRAATGFSNVIATLDRVQALSVIPAAG